MEETARSTGEPSGSKRPEALSAPRVGRARARNNTVYGCWSVREPAHAPITGNLNPTEHETSSGDTLSIEEAGRVLGVGRHAAYAAARSGRLPVLRLGRRLRVPVAALLRLLREGGVDR